MAKTLTQPYTLQLRPWCPGQGVYLRWLSPLGNWEGWLFGENKEDVDDVASVEAGSIFRPEVGPAVVLRRPSVNKRLLRAGNLTHSQHATLTTLLDSPQVYVQDSNGLLTSVLVTAAPAGRTSPDTRTTLDIEIELGQRNPLTR